MKWMNPTRRDRALPILVALSAVALLGAACGKEEKKDAARPPAEVTVLTIAPRDVPVSATFVAQTQSSQAVTIAARVSGFLDKRVYTEGAVVKAGQVLFKMDQKPFQAQVDGAAAALQRNQAALQVATANLARTKPLAAQNALSQKDLDDAQGQYEQAAASVAQSKAQLESAQLDLSYTTITSPVDGVSSFAAVADGTYVNAQNSQLTTVSGAHADVDQLQHLRKRDGAHPQPGAEGTVQASRRQPVHRRDRAGRRQRFSLPGQDHVRRSVVQLADRDVPDPGVRRQSERRAASEPIRAHEARRRTPAECDPRAAARCAAGREGSLRLGRQQGRQGGAPAGRRRRLARRQLVHRTGARRRRQGRRRRRAAPRARRAGQGGRLHAKAGCARSLAGFAPHRRDARRPLRSGEVDARRRGRSAAEERRTGDEGRPEPDRRDGLCRSHRRSCGERRAREAPRAGRA